MNLKHISKDAEFKYSDKESPFYESHEEEEKLTDDDYNFLDGLYEHDNDEHELEGSRVEERQGGGGKGFKGKFVPGIKQFPPSGAKQVEGVQPPVTKALGDLQESLYNHDNLQVRNKSEHMFALGRSKVGVSQLEGPPRRGVIFDKGTQNSGHGRC